jgi:ATPase family associated with various cellular activities (AAA)
MPAVRPAQVTRAEDALALCSTDAGPIQAFDAAVGALDPTERDLALREAGRRLRQSSTRLAQLASIADGLEALQTAAAYRAIVLGVDVTNGGAPPATHVHLALLGQQARLVAGVLPGFGEPLVPGDEVEAVQTGPQHWAVRRRIGRHQRYGVVGRLMEVMPPDLLRVSRGPDTLILRAVGSLADALAEAHNDPRELVGRQISYDEGLGLAFDLFGERERDGFVLREVPTVRAADLILGPRTARELETQVLLPLRHPELARAHGVEAVHFVIFTGPPGIGKTTAARMLATELGRPVYLTSGAELASEWYGQAEARLRARLKAARAEPQGAVFVWDEAESMLVERGRSQVGVEDRMVATLLAETDGFLARGNVLFILATNRADRMDQALRRSLRAVTIDFERPDAPRTRALFRLYLRDVPCLGIDPETLARRATLALFAARDGLGVGILRDGTRLPLTPPMAVSGALVRASCERARRLAFLRAARGAAENGTVGIREDDLLAGIADEIIHVASTLTLENVVHALTLPPGTAQQLVALERQAGNARHRYVGGPVTL